jgi:hypothetical protein
LESLRIITELEQESLKIPWEIAGNCRGSYGWPLPTAEELEELRHKSQTVAAWLLNGVHW